MLTSSVSELISHANRHVASVFSVNDNESSRTRSSCSESVVVSFDPTSALGWPRSSHK